MTLLGDNENSTGMKGEYKNNIMNEINDVVALFDKTLKCIVTQDQISIRHMDADKKWSCDCMEARYLL